MSLLSKQLIEEMSKIDDRSCNQEQVFEKHQKKNDERKIIYVPSVQESLKKMIRK